jgi:hypothetical protein
MRRWRYVYQCHFCWRLLANARATVLSGLYQITVCCCCIAKFANPLGGQYQWLGCQQGNRALVGNHFIRTSDTCDTTLWQSVRIRYASHASSLVLASSTWLMRFANRGTTACAACSATVWHLISGLVLCRSYVQVRYHQTARGLSIVIATDTWC